MYTIKPNDSDPGAPDPGINARHPWSLPGVHCPGCGATWATTGVQYPDVDLTGYPRLQELTASPLSTSAFADLRDDLRRFLATDSPLVPGTKFGAVQGKAKRQGGDITFLNPWTLLLTPQTLDRLTAAGVNMPSCGRVSLSCQRGEAPYVEPSVKALAHLSVPPAELCGVCHRNEKCDIDHISIETEVGLPDLARVCEIPTVILCSDTFRSAVESMGITTVSFDHTRTGPTPNSSVRGIPRR
jgi:uncharacterized double-CXXCG motif protein